MDVKWKIQYYHSLIRCSVAFSVTAFLRVGEFLPAYLAGAKQSQYL